MSVRFWIGVACKEHVENGVKLGICQFCHGKSGPAARLSKGDFLIYYSSKVSMENSQLYQKFTAIGRITDSKPYQVEVENNFSPNNFKPFRRNVEYFDAKHADIKPLIPELNFIKNKTSWGYVFRYGFLEIDKESFEIIAKHMLVDRTSIDNPSILEILHYKL